MYRNSRHTVLFPLLLATAAVVGLVVGQFFGRSSAESDLRGVIRTLHLPKDKLAQTMRLIALEYVDSISMDSLVEHTLPIVVSELDPHSVYLSAAEMASASEALEGEFEGIGVVFNMATDTVIVLNVIASGPSARAGVQAGDRIVCIDDTLVAGRKVPQDEIMRRLRGPRGTQVRLSLQRQGIADPVDVTVTRDAIPLRSITASFVTPDSIGFIKLDQFSRTSHTELLETLARLRESGMRKLILDLRGNAGGYLDQAIEIANEFLPAGRLIVYTEDRSHRRDSRYSDGTGRSTDLPLAVLIDERSASSSEILAGALQDNDRGVILGRRSFGKGLVQQQIPFADGSALRLTVARYYTPTGRSIQKPYTVGDSQSYDEDLWNRYRRNELFSTDSIRFADSLRRVTPGGRVVYGGGGIMPDLFVPLDTTGVSKYYVEVNGRNILYRYTIEYADRHRAALNAIRTPAELDRFFASDKHLVDDFVRYAARMGVAPRPHDIAHSRQLLEAQLRAFIGRNTELEDSGYFYCIYPVDNVIVEAIRELQEPTVPVIRERASLANVDSGADSIRRVAD